MPRQGSLPSPPLHSTLYCVRTRLDVVLSTGVELRAPTASVCFILRARVVQYVHSLDRSDVAHDDRGVKPRQTVLSSPCPHFLFCVERLQEALLVICSCFRLEQRSQRPCYIQLELPNHSLVAVFWCAWSLTRWCCTATRHHLARPEKEAVAESHILHHEITFWTRPGRDCNLGL